ncbi:heavy metal-associated isoprenylated plant protein 41-like [Macadamia integrifolia]|uniref:heavy metal-associated isoprenylated plant protein 41-like n=1 Tax=Macadamia integrifolia TaxID=60698 RepID=UPI001C4F2E08|nr:heavy metal-associated isoprenylated plant protein 41-like [Macadamia integrifolia]
MAKVASMAVGQIHSNGWLKHYSSSHQILLVGEGDFSFSLYLALSFGSASNIVATSLDSYDSVISKYEKGEFGNLRETGSNPSAQWGMLRPFVEIHINHKNKVPFCNWNLKQLAYKYSLALIECTDFKIEDYPGYINKRGDGPRCDQTFPLGKCSTFKFVLSQNGTTELQNPHYELRLQSVVAPLSLEL